MTNLYASITNTWKRIKSDFILKNSSAYTRLRFAVAFTGLTYNETTGELTSTTDGLVWGYISKPTATDANEADVPVTQTYDGTYIEWSVNTTGATFPIDVDPTFTDGYGGDVTTYKDSYASSGAATTNYGTAERLGVVTGGARTGATTLIAFNLSSITAGATCTSATLYYYKNETGNATVNVYTMVSANASGWTEAGATWNKRDGANDWAGGASGCHTSGTDYNATSLGNFTTSSGDAANYEYAVSLTTSLVDDYFGGNIDLITIATAGDEWNSLYFHASDYSVAGHRPKLVVVYEEASGATGTLDKTLDAFTLSASGTALIDGDLDNTIANFTLLAGATTEAKGTLDVTYAGFTLASTTSTEAKGTFDATIAGYTLVSTGTVAEPSTIIEGTTTWGHVTGVAETNTRTFTDNWTGTGSIEGTSDAEKLALNSGEYMELEVVNTGETLIQLLQNSYQAGDTVTLEYRMGSTSTECGTATY